MSAQGNPEFAGNEITLLPSAQAKYSDMFQAIREAKRFVHLEYFIFRNDSTGRALLDILHQKANEGLEVRLLIDAYGNYKAPDPWTSDQIDSIRSLGIQLAIFDPLRFPWIPNMLHRDHRKIVVVDAKSAYTGGMNVADYYLHGTPRTGTWRDMQMRMEGPVVDEFERIFERIWVGTTKEDMDTLRYRSDGRPVGDKLVSVVNREPSRTPRQIRQSYVEALRSAQHVVRIVNPYPTNTHSVRRAMRRALRRGIRLQIMVSSRSDNHVTPEVIGVQMKKMAKRGAEVYYYEGGFHHSKLMTVDHELASIGTANLDGRSMRYDYEVNAFVFSPDIAQQIDSIFDVDLQKCQMLTPENFRQRFSLKQRFIGRVFQILKGLL